MVEGRGGRKCGCAWRRNAGRSGEAVIARDSSAICLACGHRGFCLRWRESGVSIVCSRSGGVIVLASVAVAFTKQKAPTA